MTWTHQLLHADLTTGETWSEDIPPAVSKKYIGGRGLGVHLFAEYYSGGEPSGEPLIYAVGPVTGLGVMSGRHTIVGKSPLTGTICDSSGGGYFAVELRRRGYDAILIQGKSPDPVYLDLTTSTPTLRSAESLWGRDTRETTQLLEGGGARVSCVGPAGERGDRIACIMNDYTHACGRGGLGAVMGQKQLKAIVVRGKEQLEPADPKAFRKAEREALRLLRASPTVSKGLGSYGTPVLVNLINYMRVMPTRNYNQSEYPEAEQVSGEAINERFDVQRRSCYRCFVACKREKDDGELPEYETLWAFGPTCDNHDLEQIIRANRACNRQGVDTISCGSTIAAHLEHNGWPDADVAGLAERVANAQGVGRELAQGSQYYLRDKNPRLSMSVKGLELPGYDPRGVLGQALGYATSNRGGCHLRAYMVGPEIFGKPKLVDRLSFNGKAGLVMIFQNLAAAVDSLTMCKFTSFALSEEEYAALLSACTGEEYRAEDLLRVGERIWNLERMFNTSEGFTRRDDVLPQRVYDEINVEEYQETLSTYYHFRGWTREGVPTYERARRLGLEPYWHRYAHGAFQ